MIKNNDIKFKPCPFCGQNEEICFSEHTDKHEEKHFSINCPVCDSRTAYFDTPSEAMEAWNRRTGENGND